MVAYRHLFTFRHVPVIAGMLARKNVDAAPLLVAAGLPVEAMRGEVTAPLPRIRAFVDSAATALESDLLGIQLAHAVAPGVFGVAEFLMRSSPSVEVALQTLCEFTALINPSNHYRLVATAGDVRVHYAVGSERDALGMHLNEFSLAYIIRQARDYVDGGLPLLGVWFAHVRRDDRAVIAHFGCDVAFGMPDCGFAIARDVAARTPRTADPVLHEFMYAQARAQLGSMGAADIVTQVVHVLEARLASGAVDMDSVARAIATTSRSLQRHLAEAGTTFRDVLAHVRLRKREELRRGGIADADIATRLGFADTRAMRRSLDGK